jgi:hypothetical protein
MPYVEFSTIDDSAGGKLVPDGLYTARVEGIEERRTRGRDALWRVCLRIVGGGRPEGGASGRCVYDSWAFSSRALPRLKLIAARFGLDVGSDREVSPRDFIGREIDVEVRSRRFELDGEEREENFVPYGGYRKAAPRQDPGACRREELPPRREEPRPRRDAGRPPPDDEVPF